MTEKYEKDNKVAVLVSPGFGAGWSTWVGSKYSDKAVFCYRLAEAMDKGAPYSDLLEIAKEEFPGGYLGGLEDVIIKWVPKGTHFEITEYDGSESVKTFYESNLLVA